MDNIINVINGILWGHVLIYVLLITGIYFTVRLKFIQFFHFSTMWRLLAGSNKGAHGHVSSFQALATSLAARVGTGNMAGVAIALSLGGPGAIFWMWIIAMLGMATAFVESTLAQVFKVKNPDGSFRGGPAYYMQYGMKKRWLGILFSILLVITFGFIFNAVQANTIADAFEYDLHLKPQITGIILMVLAGIITWGGMDRIAHFAGIVVPVMALGYFLMTLWVVFNHLSELPGIFLLIVRSAFGLQEAAGGVAGYAFSVALMNGIKRGLYSNEAGMGSAPNAAAAATPHPPHPASQGYVQMLGVFIDTIVICTCTATIILISGQFEPGKAVQGIALTQKALQAEIGPFGLHFVTIAIFFFAFTSLVANFAYAESCIKFMKDNRFVIELYRIGFLAMIVFGATADLPSIWNMADAAMGCMALINIISILVLGKLATKLAKDFNFQLKSNKLPRLDPGKYPELKGKLQPGVWDEIKPDEAAD